jgi:hypothetical protein
MIPGGAAGPIKDEALDYRMTGCLGFVPRRYQEQCRDAHLIWPPAVLWELRATLRKTQARPGERSEHSPSSSQHDICTSTDESDQVRSAPSESTISIPGNWTESPSSPGLIVEFAVVLQESTLWKECFVPVQTPNTRQTHMYHVYVLVLVVLPGRPLRQSWEQLRATPSHLS